MSVNPAARLWRTNSKCAKAKIQLFEYIEVFYNQWRHHPTVGHVTPSGGVRANSMGQSPALIGWMWSSRHSPCIANGPRLPAPYLSETPALIHVRLPPWRDGAVRMAGARRATSPLCIDAAAQSPARTLAITGESLETLVDLVAYKEKAMPSAEDFAYLQLTPNELERKVGELLLAGELGGKPTRDADKIAAARRWFKTNTEAFAQAVCGNTLITQTLLGADKKERNAIFVAVFDAIARLQGLPIPVAAIAAMILNYGIKRLCGRPSPRAS